MRQTLVGQRCWENFLSQVSASSFLRCGMTVVLGFDAHVIMSTFSLQQFERWEVLLSACEYRLHTVCSSLPCQPVEGALSAWPVACPIDLSVNHAYSSFLNRDILQCIDLPYLKDHHVRLCCRYPSESSHQCFTKDGNMKMRRKDLLLQWHANKLQLQGFLSECHFFL